MRCGSCAPTLSSACTASLVTVLLFALHRNTLNAPQQSMSPSELDSAPEVKYQERIVEVAYDDWDSPILAQFVSCDAAVGRESTKAINRDVMRLTVGYVLLIAYTFIALWRNRWAGHRARGAGHRVRVSGHRARVNGRSASTRRVQGRSECMVGKAGTGLRISIRGLFCWTRVVEM